MFEVILTFQPNFFEKVVEQYPTWEQAQAAAERLADQQKHRIVRAWVRKVREANAPK